MTVVFGAQCGARRVWDNDRFDWNVPGGIYSCHCSLAINQQAPMLAMGISCLPGYQSPVLVSGVFCSYHLTAVPGNVLITAMATHLGWQVARASLLCLCWTGWNSSVNSCPRDCDQWLRPGGSGAPWSACGHSQAQTRAGISKDPWLCLWSTRSIPEGTVARGWGHAGEDAPQW